jgi:hypothetical protein
MAGSTVVVACGSEALRHNAVEAIRGGVGGTDLRPVSLLYQLPELQWLQWNCWCLQGLASTAPNSGGIQQPL